MIPPGFNAGDDATAEILSGPNAHTLAPAPGAAPLLVDEWPLTKLRGRWRAALATRNMQGGFQRFACNLAAIACRMVDDALN